jgi:hypothetical protein
VVVVRRAIAWPERWWTDRGRLHFLHGCGTAECVGLGVTGSCQLGGRGGPADGVKWCTVGGCDNGGGP